MYSIQGDRVYNAWDEWVYNIVYEQLDDVLPMHEPVARLLPTVSHSLVPPPANPEVRNDALYCTNCGQDLTYKNGNFCTGCGAKVQRNGLGVIRLSVVASGLHKPVNGPGRRPRLSLAIASVATVIMIGIVVLLIASRGGNSGTLGGLASTDELNIVGNWVFDRVVNDQGGRSFTQRLVFNEDGTGVRIGNPALGPGSHPFNWRIVEEGRMYVTGSGVFDFEISRNEFRMIFDRARNFYAVFIRAD